MAGHPQPARAFLRWLGRQVLPKEQDFAGRKRRGLVVLALSSLFFAMLMALGTAAGVTFAIENHEVRTNWHAAEARILAATFTRTTKGGTEFQIAVETMLEDGRRVRSWTTQPLVLRRGSWSDPEVQPPAPGTVIRVYVNPRQPSEVIPQTSVTNAWLYWVLAVVCAWATVFCLWSAILCVRLLERLRDQEQP